MAAVNNFGIGGVNGHILFVSPTIRYRILIILESLNKCQELLTFAAEPEEAINSYFDFIQTNPQKVTKDFLALMSGVMKVEPDIKSAGFPFRGMNIIIKILLTAIVYPGLLIKLLLFS